MITTVTTVLLAVLAQAQVSAVPVETAPTEPALTEPALTEPALAEPVSTDPASTDTTPPSIDDLAIANATAEVAPRVTALASDAESGVESVIVYFRSDNDAEFLSVTLTIADGGLFMGSLPNGYQTSGFKYYLEVTDGAGNVARVASKDEPLDVEPVTSVVAAGNRVKTPPPPEKSPTIPTALVAIPMGVGVVALAVGVGFSAALVATFLSWQRLSDIDPQKSNLTSWMIGHGVVAGSATLVGVIAFATGTSLLVYSLVVDSE